MNESPNTNPNQGDEAPSSTNASPTPPPAQQTPVPRPVQSSSKRNPWLLVSIVLLLALIGLGGYVIAQNMSDEKKNSAEVNTDDKDDAVAIDEINESDAALDSEMKTTSNPYEGWSTFSSQITKGVSFKYPSNMTVTENDSDGFETIDIAVRGDTILEITNTPWGCVGGPEVADTPKQYEVYLGKEAVTLNESCGYVATSVSANGLGQDNRGSLRIREPYYKEFEEAIKMVLASMTGVSERANS